MSVTTEVRCRVRDYGKGRVFQRSGNRIYRYEETGAGGWMGRWSGEEERRAGKGGTLEGSYEHLLQ